jgi:hypothetical protein
MKRAFWLIGAMLVAVLTVSALSDFWTDKPYTKWSAKDVRHLLSESPWGKTTTLRTAIIKQVHRETGQFSDLVGEGEGVADPTIEYAVYLRTARPVREALVREAQIAEKYDSMDDGARKAFDDKWGKFLAADVSDKIIVQVQYSSNTADIDRQLMTFWQNQTAGTLRDISAMTWPDGQRVAPVAYWAARGAGREFQLAFPRPKDGREDGAISVEFQNPNVKVEGNSRIYTKFQLKELKYGGKVTY